MLLYGAELIVTLRLINLIYCMRESQLSNQDLDECVANYVSHSPC